MEAGLTWGALHQAAAPGAAVSPCWLLAWVALLHLCHLHGISRLSGTHSSPGMAEAKQIVENMRSFFKLRSRTGTWLQPLHIIDQRKSDGRGLKSGTGWKTAQDEAMARVGRKERGKNWAILTPDC